MQSQRGTGEQGQPHLAERGAISAEAVERIVEMVGDAPEVLLDLYETYLTEAANLVNTMHTALASEDEHQLMIAAHSLKSTSATFGAIELAKLSGTLESAIRGDISGINYARQIDLIADEHSYVAVAVRSQLDTWRKQLDGVPPR